LWRFSPRRLKPHLLSLQVRIEDHALHRRAVLFDLSDPQTTHPPHPRIPSAPRHRKRQLHQLLDQHGRSAPRRLAPPSPRRKTLPSPPRPPPPAGPPAPSASAPVRLPSEKPCHHVFSRSFFSKTCSRREKFVVAFPSNRRKPPLFPRRRITATKRNESLFQTQWIFSLR